MKRGWLSREDFDELDKLLGKLGYGGYYDFLQVLKDIASGIGAIHVKEGDDINAWDLEDIKTIPEVVSMLLVWSHKISDYIQSHPHLIEEILK